MEENTVAADVVCSEPELVESISQDVEGDATQAPTDQQQTQSEEQEVQAKDQMAHVIQQQALISLQLQEASRREEALQKQLLDIMALLQHRPPTTTKGT